MKTLSDRHHQEQPSLHHPQLTQWPLKRSLLQPPRPKRRLPQRQELQRNLPQQGPRQQMYCKAYKEHLEELSQEEPQEEEEEEEEVEVEQDLRVAEHQPRLPMLPNNQCNLLKMLR